MNIGDEVMVKENLSELEKYYFGKYDNVWDCCMDDCLGKIGMIIDIEKEYGILVRFECDFKEWYFAEHHLELIGDLFGKELII